MAVGLPEGPALEQAFDYYDAVTKEDVTKSDGVKRTAERVPRLMRAYARHQGTQASIATLREDLKNNDTAALDDDTINSYLEALEKSLSLKTCRHGIPIFAQKQPYVQPTHDILSIRQ